MYSITDITNKIICGDAIEELRKFSENSVDSIVTDPPYGLAFMNKEWDNPAKQKELIEREGILRYSRSKIKSNSRFLDIKVY